MPKEMAPGEERRRRWKRVKNEKVPPEKIGRLTEEGLRFIKREDPCLCFEDVRR
jgi:hypothetical protein